MFTREIPLTLKQQCLNSMQEKSYHYPAMPEITVTREGIVKLLKNSKTNKAAGQGDLGCLLKYHQYYRRSLPSHFNPTSPPLTGRKPESVHFLRKGIKIDLRTIDQLP